MSTSNLTSGQVLPGIFGFVDYNAGGSGQAPTKRALLLLYGGATGQRPFDYPYLPSSQQDADNSFTAAAEASRGFAAACSQPESQGAEVWVLPVAAPSGGTQSVYTLTVIVPGTNPVQPGTLALAIASRSVPSVGFTTADTATTIAANLAAAIQQVTSLPFASVSASGPAITLTYTHKSQTGEDLPFRVNISPNGCGVYLSPGSLTAAVTAVGAGSVLIDQGSMSVTTAIGSGDVAAAIATKIAASWNTTSYPLTAAVTGAVVTFYMANDRDVRRMNASVLTTTGTTVNLGSGATDGTGSGTSLSYNGTVGTGLPTLTNAMANLAKLPMFRSWSTAWSDTATLSTLANNIEQSSDGSITGQKQQTLMICSPLAASVAGAIAPACTPNLNNTAPHYAVLWSPDCAVQGFEIAVRVAAARASLWLDTPQQNWNTFQVQGSTSVPILVNEEVPDALSLNAALRTYALAPVVKGDSGNNEVIKGRTTSLDVDLRLWAWSTETCAAYHAVDLSQFLRGRFSKGNILRYSEPKAAGAFDQASVAAAVKERMFFWEAQGNYDGAAVMSPGIKVSLVAGNPFAFRADWPESPPLDLDQIIFTGHFTAPPTIPPASATA